MQHSIALIGCQVKHSRVRWKSSLLNRSFAYPIRKSMMFSCCDCADRWWDEWMHFFDENQCVLHVCVSDQHKNHLLCWLLKRRTPLSHRLNRSSCAWIMHAKVVCYCRRLCFLCLFLFVTFNISKWAMSTHTVWKKQKYDISIVSYTWLLVWLSHLCIVVHTHTLEYSLWPIDCFDSSNRIYLIYYTQQTAKWINHDPNMLRIRDRKRIIFNGTERKTRIVMEWAGTVKKNCTNIASMNENEEGKENRHA